MSNILIEQLERFAREEPDDPFNLYALALEYLKVDRAKAQSIFERLIDSHQHYVPTYYQLGQLYSDQGKMENAIQTFERGIIAARNAGDQKALREMEGAKLAILYDN